jgi:hypothetical protein
VDGTSAYTIDVNNRVWKLTYNESFTGCAGYVAFHPYPTYGDYNPNTAIADDCFEWTNLTPANSGHDIRSQMVSAYQTGLNYLGQTVGPAHLGFDLGWMNSPVVGGFDGGYFSASMGNVQNHIGIMASFDTASGVLRSIRNSWNEGDCRWCGLHDAPVLTMGTWRFAVIDPHQDTGATNLVFPDSFKMNVRRSESRGLGIERAVGLQRLLGRTAAEYEHRRDRSVHVSSQSAGALHAFFGNGELHPGEGLLAALSAESEHVVHVSGRQHGEAGVSLHHAGLWNGQRNWSKLQDMQPGDWLLTNAGSQNENLVLLSVTYNSATNIDLWLLRWAAHNYLAPLFPGKDDLSNSAHASPWLLYMGPTYATNAAALDASGPTQYLDQEQSAALFFAWVVGSRGVPPWAPASYSYQQSLVRRKLYRQRRTHRCRIYCGVHVAVGFFLAGVCGSNNGASNALTQSYNSGTYAPNTALPPFFVDYRHFNPSEGGGIESNGGAALGTMSLTLVAGTSQTYRWPPIVAPRGRAIISAWDWWDLRAVSGA